MNDTVVILYPAERAAIGCNDSFVSWFGALSAASSEAARST
jgi:hypothetical protein